MICEDVVLAKVEDISSHGSLLDLAKGPSRVSDFGMEDRPSSRNSIESCNSNFHSFANLCEVLKSPIPFEDENFVGSRCSEDPPPGFVQDWGDVFTSEDEGVLFETEPSGKFANNVPVCTSVADSMLSASNTTLPVSCRDSAKTKKRVLVADEDPEQNGCNKASRKIIKKNGSTILGSSRSRRPLPPWGHRVREMRAAEICSSGRDEPDHVDVSSSASDGYVNTDKTFECAHYGRDPSCFAPVNCYVPKGRWDPPYEERPNYQRKYDLFDRAADMRTPVHEAPEPIPATSVAQEYLHYGSRPDYSSRHGENPPHSFSTRNYGFCEPSPKYALNHVVSPHVQHQSMSVTDALRRPTVFHDPQCARRNQGCPIAAPPNNPFLSSGQLELPFLAGKTQGFADRCDRVPDFQTNRVVRPEPFRFPAPILIPPNEECGVYERTTNEAMVLPQPRCVQVTQPDGSFRKYQLVYAAVKVPHDLAREYLSQMRNASESILRGQFT